MILWVEEVLEILRFVPSQSQTHKLLGLQLPNRGHYRVVDPSTRRRAKFLCVFRLWVDRKAVRCSVGPRKEASNVWFGNRLRFTELRPGDQRTIRFPMVEKTEEWVVPRIWGDKGPEKQVHTCKFKGNTLAEDLAAAGAGHATLSAGAIS